MNIFNRIILVLLLLGLIFIVTAVLIFPDQILIAVGQFLVDWGHYFAWVDQEQRILRLVIGIGIAVAFDLFLLLLIYFEIKPKRKRFIRVEQVSGGKATVSLDSIIQQLLYRLDPLPGVVKVTPTVNPKGDKIQARLDVTVTRELAVPQMADLLLSTAEQTIKDDLGLVIAGEPQIRLKVVETVRKSPGLTSPLPAAHPISKENQSTLTPTISTTAEPQAVPSSTSGVETGKEKDDWA